MRKRCLLKILSLEILICLGICLLAEATERTYDPLFYYSGNTSEKIVYLTFHDGPSEYTSKILDILKDKNIKANFFLIGKNVKKFPRIAKRIVDNGHVIGNHTYSHLHLDKLSTRKIFREIFKAEDVILEHTGVKSKFFAVLS